MPRTFRLAIALGAVALVALGGCSRNDSLSTQPFSSLELSTQPTPGAPAVTGVTVTLPAGSVDGLAAAIAAAGPGGRVLVKSGAHTESGPVVIPHTLLLEGEPGAVITSTTTPAIAPTDPLLAALHVRGAASVRIQGLDLRASGAFGNTAILLEDAPNAVVGGNRMSDYQFGIILQNADKAAIDQNVIAIHTGWQGGAYGSAFGITVINGDQVKVTGNDVSGGLFNIWACDVNGSLLFNRVHDGFIGIILCKVPEGGFVMPDGETVGAESSADGWMCRKNVATNNFDAGHRRRSRQHAGRERRVGERYL
jgi:hypothetical protein